MKGVVVMKLDGKLVKEVSRSFYLTLRLLPDGMREVISLGYLLARISDTIADTETLGLELRRKTLQKYAEDVKLQEASPELLALLARDFSSQKHEGEQVLMSEVSRVIDAVQRFTTEEQALLQKVTKTIIQGQLWDLTYFQGEGTVRVGTDEELERYTYQVAGCVGEFWTEVLALHGYISERERMVCLGVQYGKGLQLTNIVRDIPEDVRKGRIYLPGTGEELLGVLKDSERWITQAKEYLQAGVQYSQQLPKGRLKVATLLPARLGLKTLDAVQQASVKEREGKVKISRKTVFSEMAKAFFS